MREALFSLLLVIAVVALAGCTEGKTPSWLQFGKKQPLEEPSPEIVEEERGTKLASIDGRIITLEEFNERLKARNEEIEATKEIPDSVKSDYLIKTSADKEGFLERMVERELIIAEAIRRGLDKNEDILATIEALKEQLLFARIVESEKAKASVTSKEIENYYNIYKEVFKIPEERRVGMIVVSSEEKAKEIVINLLQGTDFSVLARENSIDAKSATEGGDLGFIVQKTPLTSPDKKTTFEKLEQVAFSLDLNRPSTIFKGPDGYYIIKVTEIKPARERLLSEVYNDIEKGLTLQKQEEVLNALIGNLRKNSNIIIYDHLLRE